MGSTSLNASKDDVARERVVLINAEMQEVLRVVLINAEMQEVF